MGFTLKMLVPPALLFLLGGWYMNQPHASKDAPVIGLIAMAWGGLAFVIVMCYWAARAWRRATRDSPDTYPHR
jgi:TRAP-type C4-dicarboxylate transport system permease small subunit